MWLLTCASTILPGTRPRKTISFCSITDQESSKEESYEIKRYYVMYFDQSVRGLSPGAPVEIKGIQVGEVVSVKLQFDQSKLDFRIPVVIVLEPERLDVLVTETGEVVTGEEKEDVLEEESGQHMTWIFAPDNLSKKASVAN